MDEKIMKFFGYDHLPQNLQEISKMFCDVAWKVAGALPPSAERTVALRKLLEGKDAAVRASIPD